MKKNTTRARKSKKSFTDRYAPTPVKTKNVRTTIRVPKPVIAELKKILRARRRKDRRMSMSKLMVYSFTRLIDRQ